MYFYPVLILIYKIFLMKSASYKKTEYLICLFVEMSVWIFMVYQCSNTCINGIETFYWWNILLSIFLGKTCIITLLCAFSISSIFFLFGICFRYREFISTDFFLYYWNLNIKYCILYIHKYIAANLPNFTSKKSSMEPENLFTIII